MTTFKSFATAALCLASLLAGTASHAQSSPWLVRVRALNIDPANQSGPIPALAVPADAVQVKGRVIPELDITYFFTKQLSAELVLAFTKLDARVTSSAAGAFDAGSFKALPPTLTVQWHFLPDGQFRPYVGAGLNYTRLSSVKLGNAVTGPLDLDRTSIGPAMQAGIDIGLGGPWSLNVDVKKVWIETDLKSGGSKLSKLKVDPVLIGIGVGYRF
ncbi:MAG: OmpW/AlkL family protein [Pseudomonadota bacterium]|jgi:outer membrane protein